MIVKQAIDLLAAGRSRLARLKLRRHFGEGNWPPEAVAVLAISQLQEGRSLAGPQPAFLRTPHAAAVWSALADGEGSPEELGDEELQVLLAFHARHTGKRAPLPPRPTSALWQSIHSLLVDDVPTSSRGGLAAPVRSTPIMADWARADFAAVRDALLPKAGRLDNVHCLMLVHAHLRLGEPKGALDILYKIDPGRKQRALVLASFGAAVPRAADPHYDLARALRAGTVGLPSRPRAVAHGAIGALAQAEQQALESWSPSPDDVCRLLESASRLHEKFAQDLIHPLLLHSRHARLRYTALTLGREGGRRVDRLRAVHQAALEAFGPRDRATLRADANLLEALLQQGAWNESVVVAQRMEHESDFLLPSEYALARRGLGVGLLETDRAEEAVAHLEWLQRHANTEEIPRRLAHALIESGRPEDALEHILRAQPRKIDAPDRYAFDAAIIALAFHAMCDDEGRDMALDEAVTILRDLVDVGYKDHRPLDNLWDILCFHGLQDAAADAWQRNGCTRPE